MKTVKFKDIEIVVRGPATVQDDLNAIVIARRLQENVTADNYGYWPLFGTLCSQTDSASGLPFSPAGMEKADKATLDSAYAAFMQLPKRLKDRWKDAVDSENGADNDDPNV